MNTKGDLQEHWTYQSGSADETQRLGHLIGTCVEGGDILALYGELGTGKTTLVRGLAGGLGASAEDVSSPTFVLVHEYHGRLRLAHADLYRIQSAVDLHHTGLADFFDSATVTVLEWAEKATGELPSDRLDVCLHHEGESTRRLVFSSLGSRGHQLLRRIRHAMADVIR